MTLSDLSQLEILKALLTLAFVLISLIVGLKILSKYFSHKQPELITVGLTWIFLSSPWWPLPVTFLTIALFNYALEPMVYLYLMTAFVPLALINWMYSFASLTYPRKKWLIFIPTLVILTTYMILYHVFLVLSPDLIGTHQGGFQFSRSLMVNLVALLSILITLITGFLFARKSFRSDDKRIKWKGRFLFIGIVSFVLGAMLDIVSTGNPFLQTVNRIILSSAALEYYLGFFLPDRIANALIEE